MRVVSLASISSHNRFKSDIAEAIFSPGWTCCSCCRPATSFSLLFPVPTAAPAGFPVRRLANFTDPARGGVRDGQDSWIGFSRQCKQLHDMLH